MTGTFIAILVALALLAIAHWQKIVWMAVASGGIFVVLAVFGITENASDTPDYAIGWIYFGIGLICLFSMFWLKDRKDKESDEDIDDAELAEYQKHMDDIRWRKSNRGGKDGQGNR